MNFDDLIGESIAQSARKAQNTENERVVPKEVAKNCKKCDQYYRSDQYCRTTSTYFPDGYLDICNECLGNLLPDPKDLVAAEEFCRWANYPFEPDQWIRLSNNGFNTFRVYANMYWMKQYNNRDWKILNDRWHEVIDKNEEATLIPDLRVEELRKLNQKWGTDFETEKLYRLEALYNDIDKTQSIVTAIQKDSARKMCMLSLKLEDMIVNDEIKGTEIKAIVGAYDSLAKAADFSPKTARNVGDFESVGELAAFLEKRGWKNKYYDWQPKDKPDEIIKNLQTYSKRIIVGETNMAEELNQKLEQMKIINQMEDGISDEEFDRYSYGKIDDDLADVFNEEFNVE